MVQRDAGTEALRGVVDRDDGNRLVGRSDLLLLTGGADRLSAVSARR
jgi:hypothetical protein